MSPIISPELLQIVAVGCDDSDPHLPAGRHLRWFPSSRLGFPRTGYHLFRRPSPAWPWRKDLPIHTGWTRDGVAADGALTLEMTALDQPPMTVTVTGASAGNLA